MSYYSQPQVPGYFPPQNQALPPLPLPPYSYPHPPSLPPNPPLPPSNPPLPQPPSLPPRAQPPLPPPLPSSLPPPLPPPLPTSLPPPLPPSKPPSPPPPPLPLSRPPTESNPQFPQPPRGPEFHQIFHHNPPPSLVEQRIIPPLFPRKETPSPRPLFPSREEPQREIFISSDPLPGYNHHHYHGGEAPEPPGDQSRRHDGRGDRNFPAIPQDWRYSPRREQWREFSPPQQHHHQEPFNREPLSESYSDRPHTDSYSDRPHTDSYSDRPHTDSYGDQPHTESYRELHTDSYRRPPIESYGGPSVEGNFERDECFRGDPGCDNRQGDGEECGGFHEARKHGFSTGPEPRLKHSLDQNFRPCSPDFGPRSPDFGHRSPNFGPRSPDFGPRSPDFGPRSPNFGPRSHNFRPPILPDPDSNRRGPPRDEKLEDEFHRRDEHFNPFRDRDDCRVSPTRGYFHGDGPPVQNFGHGSPRYNDGPPNYDRAGSPVFSRPPEFSPERRPHFEEGPEFSRPLDFAPDPHFEGPKFHNRGDDHFRGTPPPVFHQDEPVDNFRRPQHAPQGWLPGERNEDDLGQSPLPRGPEFRGPNPVPHHRIPLLPTPTPIPLMGADFPKPEIRTVMGDKIFDSPGRSERPTHIVVILRGLPGSGKSHIAKLIREKELYYGAPAPRLLSLDSYFLTEVERMERDPSTGRRVKKRVQEYEYEPEMEQTYRASLLKAFNKTLEEGFFPLIVVDAPHTKVHHFDRYWSNGKMRGFEVYVAELIDAVEICVARNIHRRTREEIEKLSREWEDTPPHFTRLDVTALLSDSNIDEVEMVCIGSESEGEEDEEREKNTESQPPSVRSTNQNPDGVVKSRWEEASEERLDKLDAVGTFRKRKRLQSEEGEEGEREDVEEELSLLEYLRRRDEKATSGKKKKRVRWADLEAKKEEERRKREVGFCIGGSWGHVTEEEAQAILRGTGSSGDDCET